MNWLRTLLPVLVVLSFLLGSGCLQEEWARVTTQPPISHHATMGTLLGKVTNTLQDSLNRLDTIASDTAIAVGKTGISGPGADTVLNKAVESHPAILSMITYDGNGTVVAAEPESTKVLLGQSLVDQEIVQQAFAGKEPVMSDLFPLAEGGEGMVIEYPIHSADGEFLGVMSMMFKPYELVSPIVEEAANGTPYSFQVIQIGARILYDPDPDEVGKETFNETLNAEFPEIARVARHSAADRSGYDTYSFFSTGFGKVVHKETFWSTVGLHGTEWRVMVIREL